MTTRLKYKAYSGWKPFRSAMMEIWEPYNRYGEVVLEKDLEYGEDIFKPLFIQANGFKSEFEKLIRKYWEDNYHFIADDFSGLVNLLKKYREEPNNGYLRLLPETGAAYCKDERKGSEERFSVTEKLYNRIKDLTKAEKELLLINYDKRDIYKIYFDKSDTQQSYDELVIYEYNCIIGI